jgi:hypothetical protein
VNLPPRPLQMPRQRHVLVKVRQKTVAKPVNTVIESWVDVRADIDAINRGEGVRRGDLYEINGRTYRLGAGRHTWPITGPGFHRLTRAAFKALGIYNEFGNTPRAQGYLDDMHVSADQRAAALRAWQTEQGQG